MSVMLANQIEKRMARLQVRLDRSKDTLDAELKGIAAALKATPPDAVKVRKVLERQKDSLEKKQKEMKKAVTADYKKWQAEFDALQSYLNSFVKKNPEFAAGRRGRPKGS